MNESLVFLFVLLSILVDNNKQEKQLKFEKANLQIKQVASGIFPKVQMELLIVQKIRGDLSSDLTFFFFLTFYDFCAAAKISNI